MDIQSLIKQEDLPQVHFFPVRHYSPACAIHVETLIEQLRPGAILIEGPFDFNPRIQELGLEHDLPISIFSYVRYADNQRASAFYPFCEYSPEWVALTKGLERNIEVRFIDKPWQQMEHRPQQAHRYAQRDYPQTQYIQSLAERLGVEQFDECWDVLFELQPNMDVQGYMERAHLFCYQLRFMGGPPSPTDVEREAFMAEQIERAMGDFPDAPILVVTGGYHSSALYARLTNQTLAHFEHIEPGDEPETPAIVQEEPPPIIDQGITLTPFTYERIDKMSGYASGLHGPAFYEHAYHRRRQGLPLDGRDLLYQIVGALRQKNQVVSTADVIAVETTAHALANMRGRTELWHFDLIDGIKAAVVKEELDQHHDHPMLQMAREVFCGDRRGKLGEGTDLPPLVLSTHDALNAWGLVPERRAREILLDLHEPDDLEKSQLLHKLAQLGISGFHMTQGPDLSVEQHDHDMNEVWRLQWSPEFEGGLIESALYGTDLEEAASNRLLERAEAIDRDAQRASLLVLQAAQMGLEQYTEEIMAQLQRSIRHDANFIHLGSALNHLLYLHLFDDVLVMGQSDLVMSILAEAYQRALWLFEGLGNVPDQDRELLEAIHTLFYAFRRCRAQTFVDEEHFFELLQRVGMDHTQMPLVQGAAVGGMYTHGHIAHEDIIQTLHGFLEPMDMGDFLVGMFRFAREAVQRDPRILAAIDIIVMEKHDEHFLELAPGLRLAFTFFTPREKYNLLRLLFPNRLQEEETTITSIQATPESLVEAKALVARMQHIISAYGLDIPTEQTEHVEAPTPKPTTPFDAHVAIIEQTRQDYDETVRLMRWRLVMGLGTQQYFDDLPEQWAQREQMLGYLYDREYGSRRNIRQRSGSLDPSNLTVPDWINGVHELFPSQVIERLEKDALDRYNIEELVTRPELLERAEPNPTLLKAVLRTKHLMDDNVLKMARLLVKKVVEQLIDLFAREIHSAFSGAINRRRRSFLKVAKNFDAKETIRRNLKHFDGQAGKLVIQDPFFYSRIRRQTDKWQMILVVDQSGSMTDSVIHSAITASIFWGIKALKTHLIAFDTEIVDLTSDCQDPVETLMKVQLGGGTDIGQAMRYAQSLVQNPRKTIVVLVTDFYEGGSPENLLSTTRELTESGVTLLGLAALDDQANPCYDKNIAQAMVNYGAEVGAMTPGELATWVAEKVR